LGNSLKTTGWVLLILGVLLSITGIGLMIYGYSADYIEVEIANGGDFTSNSDGTYTYRIDSLDASRDLRIKVDPRVGRTIDLYVRVSDDSGSSITNQRRSAPFSLSVDMSSEFGDYFEIEIEFVEDSDSINDVDITVYGDDISDAAAISCCVGILIPIVGVTLLIVGIVLVVVGGKKERKEREKKAWQTPVQVSPGYPSRTSQERYPTNTYQQRYPSGPPPQRQQYQYQTQAPPPTYPRTQTPPGYQNSSNYGESGTQISIPVPQQRSQPQPAVRAQEVQGGSLDREPGLAPPPPVDYNENNY
jgi:uncharacterized membrane protein